MIFLVELEHEREDHHKQGKEEDGDEDYMGIRPLIEKLKYCKAKEAAAADEGF
jgi:hypothetical protein